jgi:hypothetical protein
VAPSATPPSIEKGIVPSNKSVNFKFVHLSASYTPFGFPNCVSFVLFQYFFVSASKDDSSKQRREVAFV